MDYVWSILYMVLRAKSLSKGRGCLGTKMNITFFMRNDVLNIFYLTIFSKRINILGKNVEKIFGVHDHCLGEG